MKTDNRAAAGEAYRAAAEAYLRAWVELNAHDHAANSTRSFAGLPEVAAHAEFLPHPSPPSFYGHVVDQARARAEEIAAFRVADQTAS